MPLSYQLACRRYVANMQAAHDAPRGFVAVGRNTLNQPLIKLLATLPPPNASRNGANRHQMTACRYTLHAAILSAHEGAPARRRTAASKEHRHVTESLDGKPPSVRLTEAPVAKACRTERGAFPGEDESPYESTTASMAEATPTYSEDSRASEVVRWRVGIGTVTEGRRRILSASSCRSPSSTGCEATAGASARGTSASGSWPGTQDPVGSDCRRRRARSEIMGAAGNRPETEALARDSSCAVAAGSLRSIPDEQRRGTACPAW